MNAQRVIRSTIRPEHAKQALIDYLSRRFTYRTRTEWLLRIERGELIWNGGTASPEIMLEAGGVLEYLPTDIVEPECDLTYDILYRDAELLLVNKPGNLPTHPAGPYFNHTLSRLLERDLGVVFPVNRLDRETSGVILFARTPLIAGKLGRQLGSMKKEYRVWVHGTFPAEMEAEGFLFRDPASKVRKKRAFSFAAPEAGESERAHTSFRLIDHSGDGELSLLEAIPHTGRMHQIRATLCSLGYPVAGDKLYGRNEDYYLKLRDDLLSEADRNDLLLPRQALHAFALTLRHPVTGEMMRVEAAPPEFFNSIH